MPAYISHGEYSIVLINPLQLRSER